jgi:DHA2 family multidrug resistance protein
LLVDAHVWRLIFFVNVPIGILGVILGSRFLPDYRVDKHPVFDPLGLITAMLGFGSILYAATSAEVNGWTGAITLITFGIGLAALAAHVIVELYVVKEPMLNLRLFANRTFLNASLVGYVATIALFGAEFLMPVYLQAFRGSTALETGYFLLAVAATSAFTTPLAGWLFDKIGPRLLVSVGFLILCINTWQLSQIEGTTPMSYIVFLLALRGLAVGLTLQTTFTTALSSISLNMLPRGSSLLNSTRFVVQAVSVAVLATVLASTLSAEVKAQQEQAQKTPTTTAARFGICETPGVTAQDNIPPAARASLAALPADAAQAAKTKILAGLQRACAESMLGFEAAYRITFYASIGALLIGLFLPGWPGKWAGRGSTQTQIPGGH